MANSLLEAISKSVPDADLVEINEVAADLVRRQAGELIADLSRTRKEVVRRVFSQGIQRGWSDATIRARLAQVVGLDPRRAQAVENYRQGLLDGGVPPKRAEAQAQAYAKRLLKHRIRLIADDEIHRGLMNARRLVWADMQTRGDYSPWAVRVTKVRKDERLCAVCRPQHGRRRSLSRNLQDGPPFHPRCRCTEEVEDRGIEKREDVGMADKNPYCIYGDHGSMPFHETNEHDEVVSKAITPGGRIGDPSSLDRSPKKNWVENAGGLPRYIRMVANALVRQGKPRSRAIPMAIGIVRNWATHSNVSPQVKAAAIKAMAEWEAKKAKGRVSKVQETTWNMKDYQDILDALEQEGLE